jgi:inhibitor of cysteine peptidase
MLNLSEKDNGRSVDLKVGAELEVTLPENATTGYRWAVDHADDIVSLVSSQPVRPSSAALGAGGGASFTFRAERPGTGALALKNGRSWEGDSSVVGRFRVEVNVQP